MNSSISLEEITIKLFLIAFLLLFFKGNSFSQTELNNTNSVQTDTNAYIMKKSPLGAVLRSAVLPGLGQFYNESYWKIPIFWGVLGYLGYQWSNQNNKYIKYSDLFEESLKSNLNGQQSYLNLREFYKDRRDLFAVFIGLTYFLNLVDAYVDSHLFDFDISENPNRNEIKLSLRIKLQK